MFIPLRPVPHAQVAALALRCLHHDPVQRPTFAEVVATLTGPCLRDVEGGTYRPVPRPGDARPAPPPPQQPEPQPSPPPQTLPLPPPLALPSPSLQGQSPPPPQAASSSPPASPSGSSPSGLSPSSSSPSGSLSSGAGAPLDYHAPSSSLPRPSYSSVAPPALQAHASASPAGASLGAAVPPLRPSYPQSSFEGGPFDDDDNDYTGGGGGGGGDLEAASGPRAGIATTGQRDFDGGDALQGRPLELGPTSAMGSYRC